MAAFLHRRLEATPGRQSFASRDEQGDTLYQRFREKPNVTKERQADGTWLTEYDGVEYANGFTKVEGLLEDLEQRYVTITLNRGTPRQVTVLMDRGEPTHQSAFDDMGLVASPCDHGWPLHPVTNGRPVGGRSWVHASQVVTRPSALGSLQITCRCNEGTVPA